MLLADYPKEVLDDCIAKLERGVPRSLACESSTLPSSRFYEWIKAGIDPDNEPYTSFRKRVMKAEADFRVSCIKEIKEADPKQWQARAWLLERREAENFSEKYRLKKYPDHLLGKSHTEQATDVFKMTIDGEISQAEASSFMEILGKAAAIEEITELRQKVFEFEQKQNNL